MTDRREPVKIEVPKDESVRLGRVGLIALAGFVIGIVWPRIAGMQLVPSAPAEDDPRPKELASAASAAKAPPAPKRQAAQPESSQPALADRVKITETVVTSCDNPVSEGTRGCDEVQFDRVALSRLMTLAACPAAAGRTGLLSIGFDLDFEKDAVSRIRSGKSTSFDDATTRKLIACVEKEFGSATLEGIEHVHNDYTVFYKVELMPDKAEEQGASEAEGEAVIEASGRATVGWQVALIRKEPREGEVVARILSGTNVIVTGRQGDWYRVKYDAKGNEGWVYRSAIGL